MNVNGIQDAGEPGIAGVPVTLKLASDNSVIATTTTGMNGYYQFTGLCAGEYLVQVPPRLDDGKVLTIANAPGSNPANDSNPNPAPVTLPTDNSSDQTIDFGYYEVLNPGTGTPGYWMNHPNAWPVSSIVIGGVTYTRDQAIRLMKRPVATDKTYTMFPALVAAKLNVLIGNDPSCIASTIAAADMWMATYGPVGSGVLASSQAWKIGEPLYFRLDAYNNGLLCAPSRDS
jgi:hypothetical protein